MRKDTIKIKEKEGRDLPRKAENYAGIAGQANLFVFGQYLTKIRGDRPK